MSTREARAPLPPATPPLTGSPPGGGALDPAMVASFANALYGEAFRLPVTTPSNLPPPSEGAVVNPRAIEGFGTSAPAGAYGLVAEPGVLGGFAGAPASAGLPLPASPNPSSPAPSSVPIGGMQDGGAPAAGLPLGASPVGPAASSIAPPAAPPSGPEMSAGGFAMPDFLTSLANLPFTAGLRSFAAPPSAASPAFAGFAAVPPIPPSIPPWIPPFTPSVAPPSSGTAAGGASAPEATPPPAPSADGVEPLYFLRYASPPARPGPACGRGVPVATHLADASFASVPALFVSPDAEAQRATEGRGLASPAPSADRAVADALRRPAPADGHAPGGGAPSAEAPAYYFLPATAVPAIRTSSPDGFDVHAVRRDFPALHQRVHGKPLVWLDNAATTQKPRSVIDAISRFYERDNSNIHRGAHDLARRATEAYENARDVVRRFLAAGSAEEIVFVRGTTEAINLVAQSWGRQNVGRGDEILLTTLEHHANIVPWQMLAREQGATIKVVPVTDRGEVVLEEYARLLGPRTKLVGFPQVSNALGTILPAAEMVEMAHRRGARVLIDGAQSVPHLRADVQGTGADFFVFSGHKIFGPTGIGALYAKRELLESMPPWQGGGSMIRSVTFEQTTYSDPPAKFEAGTPNIADAVGLAAALEYVERIGIDQIARYEHGLVEYGTELLRAIPGLRLVGTAPQKASVLSFVIEGARTEDVGRYLDGEGIAVRAGHHCAQPTMQRYGLTGTVRPSVALYNTREELDLLAEVLRRFQRAP